MNSELTILGARASLIWVVNGAALLIFMQVGFALVETGFCRAKQAVHVVSTNIAIFGLGFVALFWIGFPPAFGGFSHSAFGCDHRTLRVRRAVGGCCRRFDCRNAGVRLDLFRRRTDAQR